MNQLKRYDPQRTYDWNYQHPPMPVDVDVVPVPGDWQFCGLPVSSPLGMPAGPLLNGAWCLYYASLGFDVVTYKTVRSRERTCYPLPNLQFVETVPLVAGGQCVRSAGKLQASWAVSFGMPSKSPDVWRADVEVTRRRLAPEQRLVVSVVGTVQPGWTSEDLAADYAQCARWAVDSGADVVEANFSCPNVSSCDGQLYQHPHNANLVASAIRSAIGTVPLVLKIGFVPSPDEASLLVDAVADSANALSMVNCISAFVVDGAGTPQFDGERRGIGGEAIRAASQAQVEMFHRLLMNRTRPLEIVGVGGIFTTDHVLEFLRNGATTIQIATAAMLDPTIGLKIRAELAQVDGPWVTSHRRNFSCSISKPEIL